MPYGGGNYIMRDYTMLGGSTSLFHGYEIYIIITLLIIIIIMLAYLIFKKPDSEVRVAKIEKDTEEIKDIVKELKKKWDEIE